MRGTVHVSAVSVEVAAPGKAGNPGTMNHVPRGSFPGFVNLALKIVSNALT